jgi:DNA-nicking Smr family endonuclease
MRDDERLITIRRTLAQRRADDERAQAEAARAERERRLFELTVGPVTPLPTRDALVQRLPPPLPEPRQREADERAALLETWSDEIDVETLLDTDEGLSFRRRHLGPEVLKRLRRGEWAIQAEVDLHGLTRDAARVRLGDFLRSSRRKGVRCVRVVHGKGHGSPGRVPVLKTKVRAWLVQSQAVLAFVQARASDGGHGALVVLLAAVQP